MRVILELESADPDALLSRGALAAFEALAEAGIEVTRVDPATGIADPPIVGRLRDRLVRRSMGIREAVEAAYLEVAEDTDGRRP